MTPLRLVLGTADLTEPEPAWWLFDQFYDAGGRAFDAANVYGDGASERLVGSWLRTRRRDDVVLYVKGCHPPYCQPALVAAEVEQARTNLSREVIDVFLIHRDDPVISVDTWAEALDGEQGKGNVRRVGVSNWTVERFTALRKRLDDDQLTTFSNHFSLAQMIEPPWPGCLAIDPDTARNLGSAGTTVLAWASLARGYLCGSGRDPTVERCWGNRANQLRRARAAELATRLGTTAAAVAIACVLAHEGVRPVIGTRSAAHLDEALAAEAIALTPEQVVQLESGISR